MMSRSKPVRSRLRDALLIVCLVACVCAIPPIAAAQGPGAPGAEEGSAATLWVEKILVSSSEILSDEEIASIVRPYEGRHLGIVELSEVVERLNRLYREKGFVTAMAVLPPQSVEGGVIEIVLVEGRLGEVIVEGNRYTQAGFIVDRISLRSGDLIDVARLESDILHFNSVYDVQLVARLEAGEAFGTTNAILQAVEPDRWIREISFSNSGRDETGAGQFALAVVNRGLFGRADPLTLTLVAGEASTAGSIAYAMPIGPTGGRLNLSYQQNSLQVISGDFADIQIAADSSVGSVGWRHPVVLQAPAKVFLNIDYRYVKTGTSFLGAQLLDNFVRGMTYGLDVALADPSRTLDIRQSITRGESSTATEVHEFMKYNSSLARQWRWKDRYRLSFRLQAQLAGFGLTPAPEQIALGGLGTVRGHAPGVVSGENGYAMGFEIGAPLSPALEGYAFVDHGRAFPDPGNTGPLTSVGVGFDFTWFNRFSGSLVYGIPVSSGLDPRQGRLHLKAAFGF